MHFVSHLSINGNSAFHNVWVGAFMASFRSYNKKKHVLLYSCIAVAWYDLMLLML